MFVDAQAQAMKRMEESPQGSVPAPNVRLNVGGVTFDTTRDTLSKCRYFEPYLEGRFRQALDEDGRLFVDRSGALFGFLLDFMRTGRLPLQKVVAESKDALLEECEFFGLEWMAHTLRGMISPFDLRREDRDIYEDELYAADHPLFDVH